MSENGRVYPSMELWGIGEVPQLFLVRFEGRGEEGHPKVAAGRVYRSEPLIFIKIHYSSGSECTTLRDLCKH